MRLLRRLWYWLRSAHREAELREEMATHRSLRAARLADEGLTDRHAAAASARLFGNETLAREDARGVWSFRWVEGWWQDGRLVLRALRRSPSFTLIAVGTLALGIGANTALFSIFNSLFLRTLPVRDPAALVTFSDNSWTYPIWQAIERRQHDLFDGAFAWYAERFDTAQGGEAALVEGAYVSGNAFQVLGLTPALGRLLAPADDTPAADAAVAVIGHRWWQQRFGGDPAIVGRRLSLGRVNFTIVGVMPNGFAGPDVGRTADVMIPFAAEPLIRGNASMLRGQWTWWLDIMARLKPGQTLDAANAALAAWQPQLRAETLPEGTPAMLEGYLKEPLRLVPAATGRSELRKPTETPLLALLAVVGLVLLIACANIANLLLTRALARRHELSVRLALGASRWRLVRLLLIESLVLAIGGAALGVLFARWSGALLVRQFATWRTVVTLDLELDWRVLAFTSIMAIVAALVAGTAPALGLKRIAPNDALKDAGRGIAGDRRFRLRGALVVVQLALSLVLLVGAGLFLRTFTALAHVSMGFSPDSLLVVDVRMPAGAAPPDRSATLDRLREAAAATPGVLSTALSIITPVSGAGWNSAVGDPTPGPPDRRRMTWMNGVSPGWFQTMGVRLVAGRDFDANDRQGSALVAVVNELFAARFLAGQAPIGQTVRLGGPRDRQDYRIVGVVADAVYRSPREGMVPTAYVPVAQGDETPGTITIAAAGGQRDAVRRTLTAALRDANPAISFTMRTFDDFTRATVLQERLTAWVSGFFGGLGLILSAIGLYGVIAHLVALRRTEIGIRVALGARPAQVLRLVFGKVATLLALGVVSGSAIALWASGFVRSLLFRLEPRDPLVFAAAVGALMAAALVAAWLPARRAARLEPARVLREG